jgi:hypothetical protein
MKTALAVGGALALLAVAIIATPSPTASESRSCKGVKRSKDPACKVSRKGTVSAHPSHAVTAVRSETCADALRVVSSRSCVDRWTPRMRWRGRRPRWQHERRLATGVADGPAICTDSWTCVLARADGLVTGSLHAFSVQRRRRGVLHNAFRLSRAPIRWQRRAGSRPSTPRTSPSFP